MKIIKKVSLVFLLFILLTTTGCSKRMIDKDTGQAYVENIFCQPTDKEILDVYEKHKIDISDLPKCEDFKVTTGGYEGLWTSIFVKPLSYIILKLGDLVKNYGLAVLILSIAIRAVMVPITKKNAMQSENMKRAKPALERLEKKYANKTDQQSMIMKSQEMMAIYKEYDIHPMAGCLFAFLQLPIFMAFIEAIYRVPAFFESEFLTLKLGTTASQAIAVGEYQYLVVVVLIVLATYISFKNMNGTAMDANQEQQMKIMSTMMLVMMTIASFQLPVAIALYWVTSSAFTIGQNFVIKKVMANKN